MTIEIPIKYNLKNIEIFLSIFSMQIEMPADINNLQKNQSLLITQNDIVVGEVLLTAKNIKISFKTELGYLEATTDYANSTLVKDSESYKTIGKLGLFASWFNDFIFKLKMTDNKELSGSILLSEKIDNEFGNRITPHFILKYQDANKKYKIEFQNSGKPFYFQETRTDFKEEISYQIFNNWGCGAFFHHIKEFNQTTPIGEKIKVYEANFISEEKGKNVAIKHLKENNRCLKHETEYFEKLAEPDAKEEIINKINYLHKLDNSLAVRIKDLIQEFKLLDIPIMETLFLYGFTNYDTEEIYAFFKLLKKDPDLYKIYFENQEDLAEKVFTISLKKS